MNAIDAAIYSALNTAGTVTSLLSSTTAIYSVQADDNAVLPYVVFSLQGGGDENLDQHRTKNTVYFVRAYSDITKYAAAAIDDAIDSVLHLQTLTVTGWANFWLAREEDYENVENLPSGKKIWTQGGQYRLRIEKQ